MKIEITIETTDVFKDIIQEVYEGDIIKSSEEFTEILTQSVLGTDAEKLVKDYKVRIIE